jgi:glucose-1-phosphate adenylyltransferase
MGIYIFNVNFLYQQLIEDADNSSSSHDFGKDIIPAMIDQHRVVAYPFQSVQEGTTAFWRDVGTVDAFWEANMELIGISPDLDIYDQDWPIWTYQEQLPPAKFVFDDDDRRGMAVDSMVSGGCIVSGAVLRRSLLFSAVHVHSYSHLEDAIVLPDVVINRNCRIKRAIIDKGCVIPPNTVIGEDPLRDAERYHRTDNGIVLVTPEMLGQNIHQFR